VVIKDMELKDVILSTLEELEHSKDELLVPHEKQQSRQIQPSQKNSDSLSTMPNEALFLENMKERIHVLFEGFQSPNNANIEAKVDLTLNFLEYLLSSIETRLKEIK
jgi:hypothetical protein